MMLLSGDGASEDSAQALPWIERAAAQRHAQAVEPLHYMLSQAEPMA